MIQFVLSIRLNILSLNVNKPHKPEYLITFNKYFLTEKTREECEKKEDVKEKESKSKKDEEKKRKSSKKKERKGVEREIDVKNKEAIMSGSRLLEKESNRLLN